MRIPHLIFVLSIAAGALAAQQQGPPPPAPAAVTGAMVIGVAYDSVRARPMVGARVRVDTSSLEVTTDSLGRFRILGIPAGRHALHVEYPILDTIGITLHSAVETYVAGNGRAIVLATPSQETLIGILCPAAWRARGPAALMGRVRDADTGAPATGAKVSLVWYEIDISGKIQKVPRVREGTVGLDGTYRICGLPTEIDGKAQPSRGSVTGGDVPIQFGQALLVLRSMSIASPAAVAAGDGTGTRPAVRGTARLSGRILTNVGRPIAGARVQLDGTTRAALTRPNGEFFMDSLPPGTQTISIRILGYTPQEAAVDLSATQPAAVTVTLDEFVPTLATVRVTAQRERALDDVGFSRRKRMGGGWYLDTDQIKMQNPINFSDVFRTAPGLRVSSYMGRQVIQNARDPMNGCVNIWVDGSPWQSMTAGDIDDFLRPMELAAVEVYSSTGTPAEFTSGRGGSCSTIVAWTHQKLDRKR